MAETKNSSVAAVKAGLWYTICNFAVKGLVFLTTPIFTRLLTTAEFGDYNNFSSWLIIATVVVTLNLDATIPRAKFDYGESFDKYISSITILGTLVTGAFYVVVAIFMPVFSKFFAMDPIYIHIMFISLLVAPAFSIMQARNRMFYKYKLFVALTIALSLSTVGLALVLVSTLQDRLMGRVVGQILPAIIINVIIYVVLVAKGRCFSKQHCSYAVKICLPYVPHLLSIHILSSSDRIMIKQICGSAEAGIYSLAYTCSMCISLLCTSLNQAFSPWLSEQLFLNNLDKIRAVAKKYLLIFCALALMMSFWGPEFVYIFGGPAYTDAIRIMPAVFAGLVFQFVYTMYVNIEMYDKKTVGVAIATMIAAAANIVLNALLIPVFGYVAAGYTTLIGYALLLVIHVCMVFRIGRGKVYDNKFMWAAAVLCTVGIFVIGLLYQFFVIRYVIAGVYMAIFFAVAYKYKDMILKVLKKEKK